MMKVSVSQGSRIYSESVSARIYSDRAGSGLAVAQTGPVTVNPRTLDLYVHLLVSFLHFHTVYGTVKVDDISTHGFC